MNEFNIAGRLIGDSHPPIIIAEIGINHEGSLDTAIALADAAINSGAEIVKHQTHIVEDEMSMEAKLTNQFMKLLSAVRSRRTTSFFL
jgi:N-acetylneuraminate synthase